MTQPIIEARQLSKTYVPQSDLFGRRRHAVQALAGVSLTLQPGETVGVVGESGSGKTTLARILVGLLAPDGGEVLVDGEPLLAPRGRRLQYIFQDPVNSLNPRMTVEETLSEPLIIHRLVSRTQRRARVEELLSAVQLPAAHRRRLPRELSGGERQRVGIARALATDPAVLICDEPIASLDVSVGAKILELLRSVNTQRHTAFLFISHDLRAVACLCARVVVMKGGAIVEEGPTSQIVARPRHPYTQLLLRSAALNLD